MAWGQAREAREAREPWSPISPDAMTLHCEGSGDATLASAIADSLRELTKLRGDVKFVDSLPNDGKVISDERKYD